MQTKEEIEIALATVRTDLTRAKVMGHNGIVSVFSAIEEVLLWVLKEEGWATGEFQEGVDSYKAAHKNDMEVVE